jgi:hypothetical protein
MVRAGFSLSDQAFPTQRLAKRLDEAEAKGDIPSSEEPTSFSLAKRFRPAIEAGKSSPEAFKPQISSPDSSRGWRDQTFGAVLVLGSLVPSAIIGVMLWLGAIKAPESGSIVDHYRNGPLEAEHASIESSAPKTIRANPEVERPSVVLAIPDAVQAVVGKEIPFRIAIDSAGPLFPRAIITIDGMPEGAIFSGGRPYGETGWTFRPDEIGVDLRLLPSKTGKADLHVELLTANGVNIASASTRVDITTDPNSTLVLRPEESDRIDDLLAHGHKMVEVGYLAGARAYFRRAAEAGSADAALALGDTYDPVFIDSIGAHGIKADLAQARTWYERARELGSEDAKGKLEQLKNAADAQFKSGESHPSNRTDGLDGSDANANASIDPAQKAGEAADQN